MAVKTAGKPIKTQEEKKTMTHYKMKIGIHLALVEPITPETRTLQPCDRNGKAIKREYRKRQPAKWLYTESNEEVSEELMEKHMTKTNKISVNPYYLDNEKVVKGSTGRTSIVAEFIGSDKKIDLSDYLTDLYYSVTCDTLKTEMKEKGTNTITFYYFSSKGTNQRQAFITLKAGVLLMYCVKLNNNKKPQRISDFINSKEKLMEEQLKQLKTEDDGVETISTSLKQIAL